MYNVYEGLCAVLTIVVLRVVSIASWREKAKQLMTETYALYLSSKDPRVPWYAKVFIALIVGYAVSPIDLIPDFIPILGYVDDLILIPAGISLALKMVPKEVLEECRRKAKSELSSGRPKNWFGAVIIVLIWLLAVYLFLRFIWEIAF